MTDNELLQFKASTEWRDIEIISEEFVILTAYGYVPAVKIKVGKKNYDQLLYISPKTLAEPLDKLKEKNNNKFTGIKIDVKKSSSDKFSKYEINEL